MTEPEIPFTVGQRVYWITEQQYAIYMGGPLISRYIYSGVVMSTGPAVTQVWNDNDRDPREHHGLTFANDKIWTDRETPTEIIRDKLREEQELRREADAVIAEASEQESPVRAAEPEEPPKRRRWRP